MAEQLLNDFLLGADPEVILLDPPKLINGQSIRRRETATWLYGYDHNGYVVEPHPAPNKSARALCANIKKSLDVVADHFPSYRLRAGAYYNDPSERNITLGGHVHMDLRALTFQQIQAMDDVTGSLEALDILPSKECQQRASGGHYGRKSDVRNEHGHVEYRSMCSWLFSRKTSMLCITGLKLAAVAPDTVKAMKSLKDLQSWIEGFKGKDDDVDWILNRGYFDDTLEARPDSNVKSVWRVDPSKAKEWLAEPQPVIPVVAMPMTQVEMATLLNIVEQGDTLVARNVTRVEQALLADPHNPMLLRLREANEALVARGRIPQAQPLPPVGSREQQLASFSQILALGELLSVEQRQRLLRMVEVRVAGAARIHAISEHARLRSMAERRRLVNDRF